MLLRESVLPDSGFNEAATHDAERRDRCTKCQSVKSSYTYLEDYSDAFSHAHRPILQWQPRKEIHSACHDKVLALPHERASLI